MPHIRALINPISVDEKYIPLSLSSSPPVQYLSLPNGGNNIPMIHKPNHDPTGGGLQSPTCTTSSTSSSSSTTQFLSNIQQHSMDMEKLSLNINSTKILYSNHNGSYPVINPTLSDSVSFSPSSSFSSSSSLPLPHEMGPILLSSSLSQDNIYPVSVSTNPNSAVIHDHSPTQHHPCLHHFTYQQVDHKTTAITTDVKSEMLGQEIPTTEETKTTTTTTTILGNPTMDSPSSSMSPKHNSNDDPLTIRRERNKAAAARFRARRAHRLSTMESTLTKLKHRNMELESALDELWEERNELKFKVADLAMMCTEAFKKIKELETELGKYYAPPSSSSSSLLLSTLSTSVSSSIN